MRSILVTGGSGFVGQAVVRELKSLGDFRIKVLDQVRSSFDVPFVRGSILDYDGLRKAMEGHDAVVHLAASLGVANCQKRPGEVIRTNLSGTANVLRAVRECGVKKVLFSSSSEIYGNGHGQEFFHEDDTPAPRSLYARTKVLGEAAMRAVAQSHGISCSVVRFFNVYGSGQRSDFVVPTFVDRALAGLPLVVHGDGKQLRTFTHVHDAARGTVRALMHDYDVPGSFEIFNIGSSEMATISELADLVQRVTGNETPIEHRGFDSPEVQRKVEYEIYRRVPSTAKAREMLGFRATISLEEGLREVIAGRSERLMTAKTGAA